MRKLSVFAVMFLGLLTAGCSSSNDGPSVGDVHNHLFVTPIMLHLNNLWRFQQ